MKAAIHPDYHEITIKRPSGETYVTRSTWGKEGDTLHLESDPSTHPAWNPGQTKLRDTGGQMGKMANRYAGLSVAKSEGLNNTLAPISAKTAKDALQKPKDTKKKK